MPEATGKSIFKGIAIGKILFLSKPENQVKRQHIEDTQAEMARFEKAKADTLEQLKYLYDKAMKEVGKDNAAIFEVHSMLLEDDDYLDSIHNIISGQSVNAEYAFATTGDNFAGMFEKMEDEYFKARAADIKDISERLITNLTGNPEVRNIGDEPVIIVAEDLAPSETVQMDKDKLLAFVTRQGSSNSHMAILARTMNLPALIGVEIEPSWNGKIAIVDGYTGNFIVEPDEDIIKEMQEKQQHDKDTARLLQQLKGKPTVTIDGREIKLYANIGNVGDVANVLSNDAAGIGLFRNEFLYLEKENYPTEEEQFKVYKTVAENMAGKKGHHQDIGYRSG